MSDLLIPILTITLLIFLLAAGLVITFMISSRQRINQLILLTESKLAFERELRQVETEVSENMMKRFSQELHDNIGQLLTALHIQVENQKLDFPSMAESFKPTEIYLSEISQQLRLLSRTLNNDFLNNIGLTQALQIETERLKALKRFTVEYINPAGPSNLEKNQELMVFRIFQEIVQNTLRHAGARNFKIEVDTSDNSFVMRVKDDGKGFDLNAVMASSKASGLRNMQKRAALAGINLEIISNPGEGTLFIIKKETT